MAEPRAGRRMPRPPALTARDRLNFLLTLVPWLMDNDRVTVDQAAEHFGVSPRFIRESVELIAISGVPGETAAYQPDDLFDIAWDDLEERGEIVLTNLVAIDDSPRFSSREAAALVAGLQYLSSLGEYGDSSALASLTAKLSRGATGQIAPLGVERTASDASSTTIREAMSRGVQVAFDYRSARGEIERRRVDPLRLESVDTDWYLRGWDHLRSAVRTFRLDRMTEVMATDEPIEHRAESTPLPETLFVGSGDDLSATVEVTASALPLIADWLDDDTPTTATGDRVRVTLRISSYDALARLVSGMAGAARVVEPAEARAAVAAWAGEARARYLN